MFILDGKSLIKNIVQDIESGEICVRNFRHRALAINGKIFQMIAEYFSVRLVAPTAVCDRAQECQAIGVSAGVFLRNILVSLS